MWITGCGVKELYTEPMTMRRPIVLRGLPTPKRPTPSPYTGVTFDAVMQMMQELRAMYEDFMRQAPKVKEALDTFASVKQGGPGVPGLRGIAGKNVTTEDVEAAVRKYLRQPKDGIAPTVEEITAAVLESPKLFKFIQRKLKGQKATQETTAEATPVETIVEMVMEGLTTKPLDMTHIKGLEAKLNEIHNHVRAAGEWRGGGDTVVAGAGVVITNTINGNKRISTNGGVGTWTTPPEAPDGMNTVFTVGLTAPTDVVADSSSFFEGAGYTYAAGQITFDNPPTQYVRYR